MKLNSAVVRRNWSAPWRKWFPVRSVLASEVQFGENGRVVFEFEEGRVTFREGSGDGEMSTEIARLCPREVKGGCLYDFQGSLAGDKVSAIHDFSGRIVGEDFEVVVHPSGAFKGKSMTVTSTRDGRVQTMEYKGLGSVADVSFHQRFCCRYERDHADEFIEASYMPEDENLCRVVSAVLLSLTGLSDVS